MATTAPDPTVLAAAATDAKPAKGGRRKLILIGAALLVVCAAAGGAAYMKFMRPHAKPVVVVPAPVFFTLGSFTVNLAGDRESSNGSSSSSNSGDAASGDDDGAGNIDGDRYLHIGLTLKLKDPKTQQLLTEHMPEIRSRVLLLLSAKRPADLATVAGKHALALELLKAIDGPFPPDNTPHPVSEVLFTDFVVQ